VEPPLEKGSHSMIPRSLWCIASLVTIVPTVGCGPEANGRPISGAVTFQGKPLDRGTIQFSPAEGQETLSGGSIVEGRYELPAEHGLEPGKYHVRVYSTEGAAAASDELPGERIAPFRERIPAKYNSQTTLTADVKETGDNILAFIIP
jgi:hypothetical protein